LEDDLSRKSRAWSLGLLEMPIEKNLTKVRMRSGDIFPEFDDGM
jgi:hypothetical protein